MPQQPIDVFGMGVKGVNLVKSPLELDVAELTNAQNAEPFRELGMTGIRKRPGLQKVNPTGAVVPSPAGGDILGLFPVDDNDFLPGEGTWFYDGYYTPDTFNWTPWNINGIPPNTIYNLVSGSGYDPNLTPLLPAAWIDGTYYFGGHESGQLVAWTRATDPTRGFAFFGDVRMQEAARLVATGATDDTYPLPGIYQKFGDQALVISIAGGGVQLYYPSTNTVKQLPSLPATATGSATYYSRLCVVAGLSLYSIDPDTETAWTTSATVSDAGIAALTGLALHNGSLYAGSRTNAVQPVRCYKFVFSDLTTWAATATTDAFVNQTSSPAYMLGPFPQIAGVRVNVLYFGTAGFLETLHGSLGNAERMDGTSWRVLTLDTGTAGPWHNGADTGTDDLINHWWGGATTRVLGPILGAAGRMNVLYSHISLAGDRFNLNYTDPIIQRPLWSAGQASSDQNVTSIASTFFKYPLMI